MRSFTAPRAALVIAAAALLLALVGVTSVCLAPCPKPGPDVVRPAPPQAHGSGVL